VVKKNLKLESGLINRLTDLTGRSVNQTQFLFELCGFDFMKLLELERKMKNHFIWSCPADKEEVNRILRLNEGNKRFKLTWLICKPMCRPKDDNTLRGLIVMEFSPSRCSCCGNVKFKPQWGISWCKDSEWFKDKKNGHPYFWNDQELFEVVIWENEEDGKLWGYDHVKEKELEEELKQIELLKKKKK
jgi:hypothetical protein